MGISARTLALEILDRIESTNAHADILLEDTFKRYPLKDVDKGFLTELVYGVLRWEARLDWIISIFSSIKHSKMEREILNILRLGAYQLLFLKRVPASAAINESVKLAKIKERRVGNFVNAVLRAIDRKRNDITYPDIEADPIRHISIKYSHPDWLVRRFLEELGIDNAIRLCQANNEPPPLTIRVNPRAISREGLLLRLSEGGYKATFTSFSPSGLTLKCPGDITKIPGFHEGLWSVQDEASQLISFILDPHPGEKVLDACAAPGGKATHIAELTADTGEIIALDVREEGIRKIEASVRRLGLKSVRAIIADASTPLKIPSCPPLTKGRREDLLKERFDRVLLDAPCSGTGVLRRHPEGKWQKKEADIPKLAKRQGKLIENVSRYLKPGGVMVYSVCSIIKEEGEGIIEEFLSHHPEFILEPAVPKIGDAGNALVCDKGLFKVYSYMHGMDGFFAAKVKKIGNG